jgi:hypothetical protein
VLSHVDLDVRESRQSPCRTRPATR